MQTNIVRRIYNVSACVKFYFRRAIARGISFYLAGDYCIRCGRPVYYEPLCSNCIDLLINGFPLDSQARCFSCGKILLGEKSLCISCRRENRFSRLDGVFPIYPYRLYYKNLLFAWKMRGERSLSPIFASVVDKAIKAIYRGKELPCLVPVPPRPGKIKKYGWDQVDELCRLLSVIYGYKVLKLLERLSSNQQKKKNRWERLDMHGVYGPSRQFTRMKRRDIIPKELLLLDDLVTTGATVCECADILKKGMVEKVKVLSLFIVD